MYNWSTDTKTLQNNPEQYAIWKLEQMVNFGIGEEKLDAALLRQHIDILAIDPARKQYLRLLLSV